MILYKKIFLSLILFQLILNYAKGQINEKNCLCVNIEKLDTPQSDHLYKSKKQEIRLFYLENQFNDSISVL